MKQPSEFKFHYGFKKDESGWLPLNEPRNVFQFKKGFLQFERKDGNWYRYRGNYTEESIEVNWAEAYYLSESK